MTTRPRAPSTAEGASSGEIFGAGTYQDPVLCANGANTKGAFNTECTLFVTGYQVAGQNLKPVTSTNETFGVIFESSKALNVSVDYYQIQLTNGIISAFEAGGSRELPGNRPWSAAGTGAVHEHGDYRQLYHPERPDTGRHDHIPAISVCQRGRNADRRVRRRSTQRD